MLERFNKARTRCPVAIYEEINAVFRGKNPKMTKHQNFPDLQRFYAIFVKFSIDFVD